MSTRCQIEFVCNSKSEGKKRVESILIYRHSDGYPEGVIPDLKKFLKWLGGRIEDIEYASASFIYWSKRRFEELYYNYDFKMVGDKFKQIGNKKKWSDPQDFNSTLLIGFGICEKDCFHGDIEYFYQVITNINWDNNLHNKLMGVKIKCFDVPFKERELIRKDFKLIKTIKIK